MMLAGCAAQAPNAVAPQTDDSSSALLESIEDLLRLPKGAARLRSYTRYYTETRNDQEHYVTGIFVRGKPGGAKLVPANSMPVIFDGGCDVLHLKFDLRAMRTVAFFCGGLA